jgi:hypothetical protein
MFDVLTKLYEGKNTNRKMNLRNQLKNTRMQKGESIHEYFSRISEFKEQLEAIGDTIDEDELIMKALNGLTRPWDAFIQTICDRTEKPKFDTVVVLIHTCKRELSPAHLVCPWRHNA